MAVGSIVIDLLMKTGSFVTDAGKAERSLKNVKKEAQETGATLDKLKSGAAVLGGALASVLSVNAIIKYADAWSDMKSVVGASIGDMSKSGDMMTRLVDIANASYSPISQTVDSYTRNVTVLQELGKTAGDAADFTESLNHMLVLTATRGERAASVQNALSKAMAVGKLQADGLETVLANGGEVAQALANELGTTVNGLRSLAAEGKITSQVIADAIIKPLDDVRERAGKMPATVGDAFTRVQTNVTELIGVIDSASEASGTLSKAIMGVADGIRDISINIDTHIGDAVNAFYEVTDAVKEFDDWVAKIAKNYGLAFDGMSEQTDVFTNNWSLNSAGWGDSFSEFVAKSLLEMQDLVNFVVRAVGGLDGGFDQLTTNIVAFFSNAWIKVKQGAADALNGIINAINAVSEFVGGGTIELIKVDGRGAEEAYKSISEGFNDGFAKTKNYASFGDRAMERFAKHVMGREATKIYKDNFGAGDIFEPLPPVTAGTDTGTDTGGGSGRGGSGRGGHKGRSGRSEVDKELKAWQETQKAIERAQYAAQEYLAKIDEAYNRTLNAFGMGKREQEIAEGLNKITSEYQQNALRLNESYAGKTRDNGYYKQLEILQETYDVTLEKAKDFYEQETALRGDWQLGMSAAFKDYSDEMANVYGSMGNVAKDAIGGMEDSLVDFVTTGKLSFKDLADSIIKDLVRIAIQQSITGPLSSALGGLFGGGHSFGGAGTVASVGHGFTMGDFSDGGYTGAGGKYEPAGIVHKGEGVLTQEEVAVLGGAQGFESFRAALKARRGYANGGYVGAVPSVPAMSKAGTKVEIHNHAGAQVETQTEAGPSGEELIKVIVKRVEEKIASDTAGRQGAVYKANQSAFGLAPVGV